MGGIRGSTEAQVSPTLRAFLISQLRRLSYKWPPYSEAWNAAKVSYGRYKCAGCNIVYRRKDVQLDHITPVVPTSGWDTLEQYCVRLFCDPSGLQVLCREKCHREKTNAENRVRWGGK